MEGPEASSDLLHSGKQAMSNENHLKLYNFIHIYRGEDPFGAFDRQFEAIERQMDEEFSSIFGRTSRALEQQRQALSRQLNDGQGVVIRERTSPNVSIERLEQRQPNSYSYYQSIEIRSGGFNNYPVQIQDTGPSWPLYLAAVLTLLYSFVSILFARAFDFTTYKNKWRWVMSLFWLPLAIFQPDFRAQFWAALRGKRLSVMKPGEEMVPQENRNDDSVGRHTSS